YLVWALIWVHDVSAQEKCTGMNVEIVDSTGCRFVTEKEIINELQPYYGKAATMLLRDIDTDSLSRMLNSIDKLEHATVVRTTTNRVHVKVAPMQPVARVWENNDSYYINREGKRIKADARYHMDVPVITGRFDSVFRPEGLIPLIDFITADSTWNSLVTMIKVSNRNVYLLPMIRGHIINFGAVDNIADKFDRLKAMYTEVLPIKGWDYYDTIAVKWNGQVVASRRENKLLPPPFTYNDDSENEEGDAGSMSTELNP
ncbi:MAG: cell division protein FtsQ/DivIB, partial [Muribaculaceae bacterium]|nr:cell division protein FtsQ/DivIB [Muribaculaceae bacterium]